MIAQKVPENKQIFLSTHSEDFLKGLLESNKQNIHIVRIQRDGTKNKVRHLQKR